MMPLLLQVDTTWADGYVKIITVLTPIALAGIGVISLWTKLAASRAVAAQVKRDEQAAEEREKVRKALEISTSEQKVAMEDQKVAMEGQKEQLNVIHALNNSALTASMKSDHAAQLLNVDMMEEMMRLLGREPTDKAKETLAKARGRAEELQKAIEERERQQEIINQRIEAGQKSGPTPVMVMNPEEKPVPIIPASKIVTSNEASQG